MLTQREVLKMEKKLSQNRMNGKKPSNKSELAKELGTCRQQIWYCSRTENVNNSKPVEEKLRSWINDKH